MTALDDARKRLKTRSADSVTTPTETPPHLLLLRAAAALETTCLAAIADGWTNPTTLDDYDADENIRVFAGKKIHDPDHPDGWAPTDLVAETNVPSFADFITLATPHALLPAVRQLRDDASWLQEHPTQLAAVRYSLVLAKSLLELP